MVMESAGIIFHGNQSKHYQDISLQTTNVTVMTVQEGKSKLKVLGGAMDVCMKLHEHPSL